MTFVKAVSGGVNRKNILWLGLIGGQDRFKAPVLQGLLKKQARCAGIAGLIGDSADNQIGVIGGKANVDRSLIFNPVTREGKVASGLILMVLDKF